MCIWEKKKASITKLQKPMVEMLPNVSFSRAQTVTDFLQLMVMPFHQTQKAKIKMDSSQRESRSCSLGNDTLMFRKVSNTMRG